MGLKMENFNICMFTEKSDFTGRGFTKNRYRGGNCLKRGGLGQFADLRRAWKERGGGVFEGVDTLMHTMV